MSSCFLDSVVLVLVLVLLCSISHVFQEQNLEQKMHLAEADKIEESESEEKRCNLIANSYNKKT
jgi:hypothetical protein